MKTAVAYIRVSTADQASEGVSLAAQDRAIREWSDRNGTRLLDVFSDAGISGSGMDNREGLKKGKDLAIKNGSALVVYSLSRMSRSTRDTLQIAEELERAGADLVSLSENIDTTSAAGKMVFRMLAVLAEFERDLISERTKVALAHLRHQGRKTGGHIPYGYDNVDGKLIVNKKEAKGIRLIMEFHGQGQSLRAICRELERQHYRTKNGHRKWSINIVAAIIRRSI